MITCDPRDQAPSQDWIAFPILVVEVLSPFTERHDRGDKFEGYKAISTLRDYVLIEYRRREVEVWRRDAGGEWSAALYGPGQNAVLDGVSLVLPVDLVYEDSGL